MAGGIVAASADHDLTIIGASREGLLQQFVVGSLPETVGQNAAGTVIMATPGFGISITLIAVVAAVIVIYRRER